MLSRIIDHLYRIFVHTGKILLACIVLLGALMASSMRAPGLLFCGLVISVSLILLNCGIKRCCLSGGKLDAALWQRLVFHWPGLAFARTGFQILVGLYCTASVALFVPSILWFGGCSVGLCADIFGAYELGERIFVLIPTYGNYKGDMSLAGTWEGVQKFERNHSRELLVNAALEKVYGANSAQMAHRYLCLGARYRAAAAEADSTAGEKPFFRNDVATTLGWFQKALPICKQQQDFSDYFDAVSSIAYCQVRLQNYSEAKTSFNEGLTIMPLCLKDQKYIWAVRRLSVTADYLNLNSEAPSLWEQVKELKVGHRGQSEKWMGILVSIGLSTILVARLVKIAALAGLADIWSRRSLSANPKIAVGYVDSMVTLELARRRLESANFFCERLLKLADDERIA